MWRRWARAAVACSVLLSCSDAPPDGPTRERRTHSTRADAEDAGTGASEPEVTDASAETADAAVVAEPEAPCVRREPALELSASSTEPVSPGAPITYKLTVRNQNEPACASETYLASVSAPPEIPGFRAEPNSRPTTPLASGEAAELSFAVSSASDEEEGRYALDFFVRTVADPNAASAAILSARTDSEYVIETPEHCHVAPSRELLIRHVSVVDDPRTTGGGAWSFGHLIEQAAADESRAPELTEHLLRSFTARQTINGFEVAARPLMQGAVLDKWPRTGDDRLDLAKAPMRLLAIAHRLDLVDLAKGKVGEGRFVFGVLARDGGSLLFTVIFEYLLAGSSEADQRDWAFAVHALQSAPFPSEAYNVALERLTNRYTARGAAPSRPNGSALIRVRTNENALGRDGQWEMREFRPSRETGLLEPAPLEQTPDVSFNGSTALTAFIEANQASILRETHEIPATLDGRPFQAGALINKLDYWRSTGLANEQLRHKFSLNTCDGCHGGETSTSFFQVFPRSPGSPSQLSSFLTGATERDPSTGEERVYDELGRRRALLEDLVCGAP